jgi:xanthine dehydrogenase accessory factor
MTTSELLDMARELNHHSTPYALVTVVRAIAPTSAYVGAQAIVLADGSLHGWVGGGCAQSVVVRAAQTAIEMGEAKLIRIANDRLQLADDIEQYPMACASGGTIELFIQPYSVGAALSVLGSTPTAEEARFFANRIGIRLVEAAAQASVVLIATQGQGDEAALESALRSPAAHVLMIASRRKAKKLRELMSQRGIDESQLARLQAPTGRDTGAQTPAEIALVSVAAVLGLLRGRLSEPPSVDRREHAQAKTLPVPDARTRDAPPTAATSVKFVNPVCGMEVDTVSATHVEDYQGTSYYFCCDGCWNTFRVDPAKYASIHLENRRPM